MARVTKINIGGTNYDIAHEGELKNSGFEVVTELPTTGLFAGREVMYNGKKYVYSSGWKEEITANTMYEANLLWGGRNTANYFSPIDAAMMSDLSANVMAFPKPEGISVEYSRDGGVTWLDYGATNKHKVDLFTISTYLYCGKSNPDGLTGTVGYQLRITITPTACTLDAILMKIIAQIRTNGADNCWCTFKGLKSKHVVDGNEDDTYYDIIVNKAKIEGWPGYNVLNFNPIVTASYNVTQPQYNNNYYRLRLIFGYDKIYDNIHVGLSILSLRFFSRNPYVLPSNLAKTNHLYSYDWKQNALFPAKVESKEIINFNVNNIEPTQTGNVSKTSTWLWQYLIQAVNWLKANNVRLSAYNTKVAALEQADNDNNASIQSVKADLLAVIEELVNSLAAVATSGNYDDLLNKPALVFQNIGGTISSVQIPDGLIGNAKLANPSMSLNDTTVNLGDTAILPWYVDYNEVDYPARIRDHWLQIYRNGVWANLMYLGDILPTQVGQITSLDNLDWYNEQVSEYEVDSNTTTSILNGTTLPATLLLSCTAEQLTLNLYPISGKQYGKGSLDSLISDLQGKGFSVFVENDLDAILASGSDYLVRIKISKVPTAKAIIECYVAR